MINTFNDLLGHTLKSVVNKDNEPKEIEMEIKNRFTNLVIGEFNISLGADLSGADLSGADLSGADLSGANLNQADLSGANLNQANLNQANLFRADLFGANLSGADLFGAELSGANLNQANLSGANLNQANLFRANLNQANLSGAKLSGADLFGAVGLLVVSGLDERGYVLVYVKHNRLYKAGCREFTPAEALAHWGSTDYPNPERGQTYCRAVEFIEQIKQG